MATNSTHRRIDFGSQTTLSAFANFALTFALVGECVLGQSNLAASAEPPTVDSPAQEIPSPADKDARPNADATASAKRAIDLLEQGNVDAGLRGVTAAINEGTTAADTYCLRAIVFELQEKYTEALADADAAVRLEPKNWRWWFERGVLNTARGAPAAAISDFDEAADLQPKEPRIYALRARAHMAAGDLNKAWADCDRAVNVAPNGAQFYLQRAEMNDFIASERNLADLNSAVRLAPNDATPLIARGNYLYSTVDPPNAHRAMIDFDKAIRIDVTSAAAWYCRGRVEAAIHQYPKALADLTEAVRLERELDRHAKDFAPRFKARRRQFESDQCDATLSMPTLAGCLTGLALAKNATGDPRGALADANESLKLDPNDPETHFARGQALAQLKQHDAAVRSFTTGIAREPWSAADYYAARAVSFAALDQTDDARVDLVKALELREQQAKRWEKARQAAADAQDGVE